MTPSASPRRGWIRASLRVLGSLILLGAGVFVVGPARCAAALRDGSPGLLAAAGGAALACVLVRWAKWHLLASASVSTVTWRESIHSLLAGSGVSLTAHPWERRSRGAVMLGKEDRLGLAGLALLDIMLDLLILLSVMAVLAFGPTSLAAVALGLALLFSLLPHVTRLQWTTKGPLQRLACALDKTSVPVLVAAIGLSMAVYGCMVLEFHLLVRASGGSGWDGALKSLPLILAAALVPVGIPGVGLPECVAALALSSQGQGAQGVLATMGMFLLNRVAPCLLAQVVLGARVCRPPEV